VKEWITPATYNSTPAPGWQHGYDPDAWGPHGKGLHYRWKEIKGSTLPQRDLRPSDAAPWKDRMDSLSKGLIEWHNIELRRDTTPVLKPR
jgi:hypothetical protein